MSPVSNTVFVLGAGFSVEQRYPLARDMREAVIPFFDSEQNPWKGAYNKDQFCADLRMIGEDGKLPLEELLLKLAERLKQEDAEPCHRINEMLGIGVRGLLWKIYNSTEELKPAYRNFAAWLGVPRHRHGIISFNWDLQAERLLHQERVPWHYDREVQGLLPVIKPHGSINWNRFRQEDLKSDYPHWQSVSRGSKLSFNADNPLSNPRLDEVVPNLSYTVFPGDPDRPESHDDMKLLWRDAAHLMDMAEEVTFIGYSFPDYDLCPRRFFNKHVQGKKVVVVNPSRNDLQKSKCVLGAAAAEIELREETFPDCPYAQLVTDT